MNIHKMAPASTKRTEPKATCLVSSPKDQRKFMSVFISDGWEFSVLFLGLVREAFLIPATWRQGVAPLKHYDILQFPLEDDDDEYFGGLCGGLKDLERLRLLALLPLLLPPEAVLLVTE